MSNILLVGWLLNGPLLSAVQGQPLATQQQKISEQSLKKIDQLKRILNQAATHLTTGRYHEAKLLFDRALTLADQTHNLPLKALALSGLGDAYMHLGDRNKVLAYHMEALKINQNVNKREEARNLNGIGVVLRKQSKWAEATDCFLKALAINRAHNEDRKTIINLLNLADTYNSQQEYNKALRSVNAGLVVSKRLNDIDLQMACRIILGEIYERQSKLTQALDSYEQAAALPTRNPYGDIINVHINIARLLQQSGQYRQSNQIARLARQSALAGKQQYLLMQATKLMATNYASLGQLPLAYEYLLLHNTEKDSLLNQERIRQISTLQTQYETEKKESSIRFLTQQNQLQRAEVKRQHTLLGSIVVTACLLLLVVLVLNNRYRLKQKMVTLLERQNAEIEKQNAQKELLLKEIHHRVKNNLQIILSLLNTQTESLHDGAALMAIRESQCRVQSMALIHQNLYQSDNLCRIDMPDYIQTLLAYLMKTLRVQPDVQTVVQVDPIQLDVSAAVPLGLIINEAVTNVLKYAFPAGLGGTLRLSLLHLDSEVYRLTVEDDGVGLPAGFDWRHSRTLGTRLIDGLTDQLNGQWQLITAGGVTLTVDFPKPKSSSLYERLSATADPAVNA